MSKDKTYVGFGFGAIQSGLLVYEAFRTGNFKRLVVAEVVPQVVEAVRRNGGKYVLNVATGSGVVRHEISCVEIFNPTIDGDREKLADAIAEACEIGTALPSVKFYGTGKRGEVVDILVEGLKRKAQRHGPRAVVYTAENHNHAAEILEETAGKIDRDGAGKDHVQYLNTVIGKMSGVVVGREEIEKQGLAEYVPGAERAFLVEEFNRILITRIGLRDFVRGISVFEEKDDLLAFEEAKLYGHNAVHSLIGYLLQVEDKLFISDAAGDPNLMQFAREAFVEESGVALCRKYSGLDPLFTRNGFAAYADDLLKRMVNPWLKDTVERITRDPRRKLGWDDRLVGTIRLVWGQGIEPVRFAVGAAAALSSLEKTENRSSSQILDEVWKEGSGSEGEKKEIRELIVKAKAKL